MDCLAKARPCTAVHCTRISTVAIVQETLLALGPLELESHPCLIATAAVVLQGILHQGGVESDNRISPRKMSTEIAVELVAIAIPRVQERGRMGFNSQHCLA